ncbi:MAG: polysaccharide biosynthesis protein [Deltaproteobacteria bacterium]|nr:polysaccharide biosynthesis protein [Deltaproteobacteria bacterium]TLN02873.1 MAG: polysaccharide biosynthesis protein [bacterium]
MIKRTELIRFEADTFLILLAFVLSYFLRFDAPFQASSLEIFWEGLLIVLAVQPLVFLAAGMYRNLWCYPSVRDAWVLARVVTISATVTSVPFIYLLRDLPNVWSLVVMDWILLLFLIFASRLIRQHFRAPGQVCEPHGKCPALIVGAGQAGSLLLKEIDRLPRSPYKVLGFIDDDPAKQGMFLHGVRVEGTVGQLREIVSRLAIEEVIIAIPSAEGKKLRAIVAACKEAGVRFKTLPYLPDIINGKISVSQVKDVEITDLLGREPVMLDEEAIRHFLKGEMILVTGAAGSIGSEICRQIAKFGPEQLLLLDHAETPLYHIHRELAEAFPDLSVIPIIGDVKNRDKLAAVFGEYLPDVVFHAAAYKHVPMMESNQFEAVTNNIGGTKILADVSHQFGVRNFVMISTDKAVNPANVMGASKRAAEMYIQALAGKSRTRFTTVRFGNVLGSNGSVIPLFMEQIKNGGPVTVTDPKVIRYFMTIPEASQLVLQAACLGKGGEIFVLDMGEPVRIVDLAEELIRLSGLVPYEDIEIVFTGLRPGEKMFEELLGQGEGVLPTSHEKIRVLAAVETDFVTLHNEVKQLLETAECLNLPGMVCLLHALVPGFCSGGEESAVAPAKAPRSTKVTRLTRGRSLPPRAGLR